MSREQMKARHAHVGSTNRQERAQYRDDHSRLLAALDAVEALHKPIPFDPTTHGVWHGQTEFDYMVCDYDRTRFPCPTVRAIRDALGEDA